MKDEYDFSEAKRGPIAQAKGKTRITIMIDDAVLEAARTRADEQGTGYQTLINTVLKQHFLPQKNHDEEKIRLTLESIEKLQREMLKILGEQKAAPHKRTVAVKPAREGRLAGALLVKESADHKRVVPAAARKK